MNNLLLNNEKAIQESIIFLKQEFEKRNKTKAILGISGGIDSALAGFICKKAGLDLYIMLLPYQEKGLKESTEVANALNLPKNHITVVDITKIIDFEIQELQEKIELNKIDKGNIMARQRMIIQYALARNLNGLVVGTENLSEYYLGYFTLYGDQACDISPISKFFKTQVFALAEYLNIPKSVLNKQPSADLWEGQTDENEFGFSYRDADLIIYFSKIKRYSEEEIIREGFNQNLVDRVLKRVDDTEYKRQECPKLK